MYKYHSIEQFRNVIKDIGFAFKDSMPILEFQGTVKIHGTNASVVLPENYAQSRNNIITVENDNAGFARFHNEKSLVFLDFYSQINTDLPIVIYGEWAGKGIQRGVGISEIERSFFIFGVKVLAEVDTEKMNSIADFVAYAVTESRLNQAWNELFEKTNVEPDIKLIGSFIKWVSQDVSKEEADVLTDNNLTMKDVGGILSKKAKQWFMGNI